jgi:hypothetical protein
MVCGGADTDRRIFYTIEPTLFVGSRFRYRPKRPERVLAKDAFLTDLGVAPA